jgi:hypothetical protein
VLVGKKKRREQLDERRRLLAMLQTWNALSAPSLTEKANQRFGRL